MRFTLLARTSSNTTRVVAKVSSLRQAAALVHDAFCTGEVSLVRDRYFGVLWNTRKDGYGPSVPELVETLRARLVAKRNEAERKANVPVTTVSLY